MSKFLNHVTIQAPANGTASHTVSPSSGTVVAGALFTPTAGRVLVCLAQGGVTSTTPTGWTLAASAVNFTGTYVWYLLSAAGGDSITTTQTVSIVDRTGTAATNATVVSTSLTGSTVNARLSAASGAEVGVLCRVTTSTGRILDDTWRLTVVSH